ncbi:MAG: caspase family protein [Spirochaetes bacterium]|nr:caspase family protein [Spirochaetota bacterium]
MLRLTRALMALSLLLFSALHAAEWQFDKTHGVIVGVLKWKDASLSPFSDKMRKDRELHALLAKRGAKNIRLLIDSQGTKKAIETAVREAAAAAPADGTFFFYYAGHGIQVKGGAMIANADIDSNRESTGVSIRQIAELIAANFKGKFVILSGDFCYSGAFEQALKILAAKGKQVAVVASATASNTSSGNWTFTQTFIDCIAGSPFCDRNGDGSILLSEVNEDVAEAMKYRERQRNGFFLSGVDSSLKIATASGRKSANTGEYVIAPYEKRANPARIIARNGNKVTAEFYFYSEKKTATLDATQIKPFDFRSTPAGSKVRVLWNGKSYEAQVLKEEGGFHYITYTGFGPEWNEWVMADRIVAADTVLIEWKGKWYPGRILKKEGGKTYVSYEGFGDEWNEWVPASRLKKP